LEAYRELGRNEVPVLVVPNRSPAALTAARLILNRAVEVGVAWTCRAWHWIFRRCFSSTRP
jgi:hypothetical protein